MDKGTEWMDGSSFGYCKFLTASPSARKLPVNVISYLLIHMFITYCNDLSPERLRLAGGSNYSIIY